MSDFMLPTFRHHVKDANPVVDIDTSVAPLPPQLTAWGEKLTCTSIGRAFGLLAFALSCALHAAPVGLIVYLNSQSEPLSAGETMMEVEFVVAEAETQPLPIFEASSQPPDPMSTMPPSVDAAQAPDKKTEIRDKLEESAEIIVPIEEPEPVTFKAEDTIISVANAAPVIVASSETLAAASDAYRARVARHLARFKRFPQSMPRKLFGGQVTVGFSLGQNGEVIEANIIRSSQISAIDDEAIAMLRRAEPFPRSSQSGHQPIAFIIPITYRMKD